MEEFLKKRVPEILTSLHTFIHAVEADDLTNKLWFLDFEDALNKLSTMDHNKKDVLVSN